MLSALPNLLRIRDAISLGLETTAPAAEWVAWEKLDSPLDTVHHAFAEAGHLGAHILQPLVHVPEDVLWLPGIPFCSTSRSFLW